MRSPAELDNLLVLISRKDMAAFEEFYQELGRAVYGLAYAVTKSPQDAEDIMQNTFIRVWDKAELYRQGTNAKAWTMKIAQNFSLTRYRENRRFAELDYELPSEDVFAQTINSQMLNTILAPLKKDEREIVVLYAMGFSHKEIAQILKKPYATVRWKYRYVLNKLYSAEKGENYERA